MIVFFKVSSCLRYRSLAGFIPAGFKIFSARAAGRVRLLWNKWHAPTVYVDVKKKNLLLIVSVLGCAVGAASLAHPFGNIRDARSSAPLFAGTPAPSAVMEIVSRSCRNCHSEKTEWPLYSLVAPMSWMVESDVRDARIHMNLSRWNDYDSNRQRQILTEIGSLVRNRQMPPRRYLLLHPDARLSDSDSDRLYQWSRAERQRLKAQRPSTNRTAGPGAPSREQVLAVR
jgi:hypothetical protein